MEDNLISAAYNRFNQLVGSKNSVDSICSKMNAEFHACFYRSQGSVWMSYTDEKGKPSARKLGV